MFVLDDVNALPLTLPVGLVCLVSYHTTPGQHDTWTTLHLDNTTSSTAAASTPHILSLQEGYGLVLRGGI